MQAITISFDRGFLAALSVKAEAAAETMRQVWRIWAVCLIDSDVCKEPPVGPLSAKVWEHIYISATRTILNSKIKVKNGSDDGNRCMVHRMGENNKRRDTKDVVVNWRSPIWSPADFVTRDLAFKSSHSGS
jgi:hypothetical protein